MEKGYSPLLTNYRIGALAATQVFAEFQLFSLVGTIQFGFARHPATAEYSRKDRIAVIERPVISLENIPDAPKESLGKFTKSELAGCFCRIAFFEVNVEC